MHVSMIYASTGTWNMHNCKVPSELDDFLLPKDQEYSKDLYVVGGQESTQEM